MCIKEGGGGFEKGNRRVGKRGRISQERSGCGYSLSRSMGELSVTANTKRFNDNFEWEEEIRLVEGRRKEMSMR